MTRKAGQKAEVTRSDLLAAATEEFSSKGFQKASLRTICSNAGVTTGALYFFFRNKEDLLREVLVPVEENLDELISGLFAIESSYGEDDVPHPSAEDLARVNDALDGLYENRGVVEILVNSRDVPAVSDFVERVVDRTEAQVKERLEELGKDDSRAADEYILHWTAHLRMGAALHVLRHSDTKEEALRRFDMMTCFIRGGLHALAEGGADDGVLGAQD